VVDDVDGYEPEHQFDDERRGSQPRRRVVKRLSRRAGVWTFVPAAAVAATAVVLLVIMLNSPAQRAPQRPGIVTPVTLEPAAKLLTPFSSCGSLLAGLRAHAAQHVALFEQYQQAYAGSGMAAGSAPMAAERQAGADTAALPQAAAAGGKSTATTSATNVQEIGVDEPDIVKTDGDRVVTVANGRLRVLDGSTRTVVGSLDLTMYAGWQSAQLLTAGTHAIVLLHPAGAYPAGAYQGGAYQGGAYQGEAYPAAGGGNVATNIDPGGPIRPVPAGAATTTRSTVLYVDLAGTPKVVGTLQADGDILDARMVASTVRLVLSSSPRLNLPQPTGSNEAAIKSAIGKQPMSAWLPTYTINGLATKTVPCAQVSAPKDYTATSTLTVYTLNPTAPNADPQPISLEADGNTVYATATSLYVASNPYCAYCYGAGGTVAGSGATQLHRFDIAGTGVPVYLGSGSVPGSLLSQYSLSDYDGSLRVATTIDTAQPAGSANGASGAGPESKPTTSSNSGLATSNSVYVLDDATLKVTGHVDGLGRGERLYAVRFLGRLGYVVTYNQVDPLYVLDLADPHRPRVMGSLELSGFSSYLHDIGSGRLIGVGQDTTPVNEGGGVYAHLDGLLVQMFDVTNPSKPARTARIALSNTPGQAEFDPHAFLYWQPAGLVVVPIGTWSPDDNGKVLAVRVSGKTLVQVGTVANQASGQLSTAIERSLIVDNALWTVSPSGIRVSDQATLAQRAWIDFG
jgi:uncharacterized secreted protein with C-terminal beta-propeller domain